MEINENSKHLLKRTGVYKIVNKVNGKTYYGSASRSFASRWKNHRSDLRGNRHCNVHLQHAYNKYGEESFQACIVLLCEPKDCVFYEQLYLDKYFDNGINCYNIIKNAINIFYPGPEIRNKMSKYSKGKLKTQTHKNNMSKSLLGNKRWLGRHHTEASKLKISKANKGNKLSPSSIAKMITTKSDTITFNNETLTIKRWAEKTGINYRTILDRLRKGWPTEKVLTLASNKFNNKRTKLIIFNNQSLSARDWAKLLNISVSSLRERLNKWPIEEALTIKKGK